MNKGLHYLKTFSFCCLGLFLLWLAYVVVSGLSFTESTTIGEENIEAQPIPQMTVEEQREYNYNILKEQVEAMQCEKRQEKQDILDELSFRETKQYLDGKWTPDRIIEIDKELKDNAIGDPSSCTGIDYIYIRRQKNYSFAPTIMPKVKKVYAQEEKDFQRDLKKLVKNAVRIGMKQCIADYIAAKCMYEGDPSHCFKYAVGVSNAESGMFKRCYLNNCYGVMSNGKIRQYKDIYEGIDHRIKLYGSDKTSWGTNRKSPRYKRQTPQDRLNGKYCVSECEHWTKNVSYAIKELNK